MRAATRACAEPGPDRPWPRRWPRARGASGGGARAGRWRCPRPAGRAGGAGPKRQPSSGEPPEVVDTDSSGWSVHGWPAHRVVHPAARESTDRIAIEDNRLRSRAPSCRCPGRRIAGALARAATVARELGTVNRAARRGYDRGHDRGAHRHRTRSSCRTGRPPSRRPSGRSSRSAGRPTPTELPARAARVRAGGAAPTGPRRGLPRRAPGDSRRAAVKARSNDTDYRFRPHSAFAWLTGLGTDREPDAVLVLEPTDAGHEATLVLQAARPAHRPGVLRRLPLRRDVGRHARVAGRDDRADRPLLRPDLRAGRGAGQERSARTRVRLLRGGRPGDHRRGWTRCAPRPASTSTAGPRADAAFQVRCRRPRLIKDAFELDQLRQACADTAVGFEAVVADLPEAVRRGRGERWVEGVFGLHARHLANAVGYDTIAAVRRPRQHAALDPQRRRPASRATCCCWTPASRSSRCTPPTSPAPCRSPARSARPSARSTRRCSPPRRPASPPRARATSSPTCTTPPIARDRRAPRTRGGCCR